MNEDENLKALQKAAVDEAERILKSHPKEDLERNRQLYSQLMGELGEPAKGQDYTDLYGMVADSSPLGIRHCIRGAFSRLVNPQAVGLQENFKKPGDANKSEMIVWSKRPVPNYNEYELFSGVAAMPAFIVVEGNLMDKDSKNITRSYMLDSEGQTTVTERWTEMVSNESGSGAVAHSRIIDTDIPQDFWQKVSQNLRKY